MKGSELRSVINTAIAFVGLLISCPSLGFAQAVIPPAFQPFETENAVRFGGRFNHSIKGFFDLETKGILSLQPFNTIFKGFGAVNLGFGKFASEAQASVDQVPIPSGSVSVAYTFDPKLETFVRWERPFSPALSLNARTDGRKVLTIGAAYSYVDYKKFEGQDRERTVFSDSAAGVQECTDATATNCFAGRPTSDETLFDFRLRQNIFTVALSYGLLDNFDVGILIPVFEESFRASVVDRFFLRNSDGTLQPALIGTRGDGTPVVVADNKLPPVRKIDRNAFAVAPGSLPLPGTVFRDNTSGIGDVILRSKAFFGSSGAFDFGGALNIAVPTGDEEALLGVGSVRFDPRLLISTSTARFAFHTNQGAHLDVDESDRDRYDYSVGGEALIFPWMTILLDQVGRIEFSGSNKINKFDIVPGVKVNPYGNFVVGFNAIVPLNDAGLRTDFTPNASAEVSVVF